MNYALQHVRTDPRCTVDEKRFEFFMTEIWTQNSNLFRKLLLCKNLSTKGGKGLN